MTRASLRLPSAVLTADASSSPRGPQAAGSSHNGQIETPSLGAPVVRSGNPQPRFGLPMLDHAGVLLVQDAVGVISPNNSRLFLTASKVRRACWKDEAKRIVSPPGR